MCPAPQLSCINFAQQSVDPKQESHEKEVVIPVTRYPIFLALLGYLYTDTINVDPQEVIELFEAADLYVMDRLQVRGTWTLADRFLSRFSFKRYY